MIPELWILAIANHLWQSTAFVPAAWLLAFALRKNQARARYWLWLIASAKFLVPFSWFVSVGAYLGSGNRALIAQPRLVAVVADLAQPFPTVTPVDTWAAPAAHDVNLLPVIFLTIWACGFAIVAFCWWRKWRRVRSAVRTASWLDLEAGVPVLSSRSLIEPGIFGIFRPMLLLPDGISDRLTPAQMDAIVAHEMCHVRRRDNLTATIHMLVEAVFWFRPLVWWIGSRMVEERERACDEEVLRLGGDPEIYAEGILNVCKFYVESPLTCVSGVTGSELKARIVRIMTQQLEHKLTAPRKVALAAAAIMAVVGPVAFGIMNAQQVHAQASDSAWEKAAGGHAEFDVASVKKNPAPQSPNSVHSNVDLTPLPGFTPTGGLFSATDYPLTIYMFFAYKLTTDQVIAIRDQLPKWAITDRYDVEARAAGNPTKDQYRLMMQALLADRFKLAIHFETKEVPVLALVLDKPGKLGPQLQHHTENPPCASATAAVPGPVATVAGGFPQPCGVMVTLVPPTTGRGRAGARGVSMAMLAGLFSSQAGLGISRPVVDETGLTGMFDFVIEFAPQINGPLPPGVNYQPDPDAPTFLEALKEQLGLKLESGRAAPVDALIIDHIEEPSGN